IPQTIKKITQIHEQYRQLNICVDGGVTKDNIALLAKAGANQFVAGSAIFNSVDYTETIHMMRAQLKNI
ncbi:MAG: ribulose-phosphate 3-epimerase, partial [bacterium]|nr:ribulose-phosphate 3-epimerase [bacterium]